MKIIQLLFTLAPVALASPVSRSEGSQDVHIVLELSKLSAVTAVCPEHVNNAVLDWSKKYIATLNQLIHRVPMI
jgi:hypothetical protein